MLRLKRRTGYTDVHSATTGKLSFTYSASGLMHERISETKHRRGCNSVEHLKCVKPANGCLGTKSGLIYFQRDFSMGYDTGLPPDALAQRSRAFAHHLSGDADNNEFELIPFLMDLDSTIAMFSKKFLRELSYGAVTWGVLPFISDLTALVNSLRDLFGRYEKYSHCQEIKRSSPWFYNKPFAGNKTIGTYDIYALSGKCYTHGSLTFNPVNAGKILGKAQLLLDELGVHPDLKTAWDIVPLSFVVDYFIPIGDMLESLHPRGWGSTSYIFEGFQSSKATYEIAYDSSTFTNGMAYVPAIWSYYSREYRTGYQPKPLEPEFKAPSLKEIFNTIYLQGLLRKVESGFLHEKIYDHVYKRPKR
jgi:hypothetical protein